MMQRAVGTGCLLLFTMSAALASDILGTWVSFAFSAADARAGQMTYEFKSNGTFTVSVTGFHVQSTNVFRGTYLFKTNALTLTVPEEGAHVFSVEFSASDEVKLTDAEDGKWIKCTRLPQNQPSEGTR